MIIVLRRTAALVVAGVTGLAGLALAAPPALADSGAGSAAVTLLTGQAVPIDPAERTEAQETAYRDQINLLEAQGELTPSVMAEMGLSLLTPPSDAAPVTQAPPPPSSGGPITPQACSIGDAATSASAISVARPTIVLNGSSQNYILYATGRYQWATDKPYSACTGPVAVGGVDGFAVALNRSSTNRGLSFTGCNLYGSCAGNGYLEANSAYGGGWALQDYAGNALTADGPTHSGTLTYGFRLSSLSGCTQAFTKYGHSWNSTAVNGFSIGPWSIGVQWTSSSSNWTKSSQAGSYGSC
jgi:hypothetical protein